MVDAEKVDAGFLAILTELTFATRFAYIKVFIINSLHVYLPVSPQPGVILGQ